MTFFKIESFLNLVERGGNKLPNPTLLFIYLSLAVIAFSALCALLGVSAVHPVTQTTITVKNLLSVEGLHMMLNRAVINFTSFAPIGTVLVAVIGIGVAEHSGLLKVLFTVLLKRTPRSSLSLVVVLLGVLSSLFVDTGYVVLIPLAALLYKNAGLNPIAGIAAAFAGVSGGYSANLLVGPLDALLAGISTEAAHLIDPNYSVNPAGNYYFMLASTLLITVTGAWVTEKISAKRYVAPTGKLEPSPDISASEKRALKYVGLFTLFFLGVIAVGLVPYNGILRDPDTHSILRSPFISGIVFIVSVYCGLAGLIFGKAAKTFRHNDDIVTAMDKTMATMASYIILMFFAAQFVNYFAWSQLGSIFAINSAETIGALELHPAILLTFFVSAAAFINLFFGSASAKWALLAPVFVPMFMLLGISPEGTQIAYRIGDSCTNIITPLMPYFGVVIAFVRKYDTQAGIGTISSMMLPYSVCFLLAWSAMLCLWILFDLPLGVEADSFLLLKS